MTKTNDRKHRSIPQRIAQRAMLERGLFPDFPVPVLAGLIAGPNRRRALLYQVQWVAEMAERTVESALTVRG